MKTSFEISEAALRDIDACIDRAVAEDLGSGDATTEAIIPTSLSINCRIIAKQTGTIAGLDVAARVFAVLDNRITFRPDAEEGARVDNGAVVAQLSGSARSLLTAERTALNFLGRMSGIATLTRQFVDAVAGTGAKILDTRKTAPGLRTLDKLAVLRGGGCNHRVGLFDMMLIKDNHIAAAGSLPEAVRRARAANSELEIEVEAADMADVQEALALGVERILLDNMSVEMMSEAVKMIGGRAKTEASGNVTLETVRKIAE
ncbi:MAG TPA: carboxylating nicotinate-nucleotide diphosphorylase, partial [Pyrinomonadaceae bacterium]|nr:carboxylating nicotinate-nucleotide diphosphorylase [Pyrinomonadaceae bacterium]